MILDSKALYFSTLVNLPIKGVTPSGAVGAFCLYDTVTMEPVIWAAAGALVFGGSITFSGSTLTAAVIDGGLTATGSASNDFSGSTGPFKTSTGAATFGGSTNTFSGGPIIETSIQSLSGAGAVNVTTAVTKLTTTGANALTLADGANGQKKTIVMIVDGGDGTLTPTTKTGFTTITFNDIGDGVQLQFFTTVGWICIANNGATLA